MKVYTFLKSELSDLAGFFKSKLGYTIVTMVLEGLRAKLAASHPDWVLPTPAQLLAVGVALIGCHTLTDIMSTVKGGKLDDLVADLEATKAAHSALAAQVASIKEPIPAPKA